MRFCGYANGKRFAWAFYLKSTDPVLEPVIDPGSRTGEVEAAIESPVGALGASTA